MPFVIAGGDGRVKTKGIGAEHSSPHDPPGQHAAKVIEFSPTNELDTLIFREPSDCAGTVTGTHAGPVIL
jgi:hypothetical protein